MPAGQINGIPTGAPAVLEPERSRSPAPEREPPAAGLLDAALAATGRNARAALLEEFLASKPTLEALACWSRNFSSRTDRSSADRFLRSLGREIARLDRAIAEQVDAVLHHPVFQKLEASWRGLWYLTGQMHDWQDAADQEAGSGEIRVRILNVSKRELAKDFSRAAEFDQSEVFKKVYGEEFGTAGGEPFGLLIGDYEFTNHVEDLELLTRMSEVAAAAFAPFVSAAAPEMLGLEDFGELERPIQISSTFDKLDYLKWRALRDREEARFLGLTLPRVLMRVPYADDGSTGYGFRFREGVEGKDRSRYLWANAAYAFGSVLIRAFAQSGWFAEIRGVERGVLGGGLVTGLPVHSFATDREGIAPKMSTEVCANEVLDNELSELGFIPLSHCHDTEHCAFYTNQSVQKPRRYDEPGATVNAAISSMLQYMLCASRFAHYLKVLARNKIGTFASPGELQSYLNNWLHQYVAADERAPASTKARYPLREASVEVSDVPGQPGSFQMVVHLLPHFQLDELTATIRLVTRLNSQQPA